MNLFLRTVTGSKENSFDIQTNDVSDHVADTLSKVHARSRCDSTSSFSDIVKVRLFKTACKDEWYHNASNVMYQTRQSIQEWTK